MYFFEEQHCLWERELKEFSKGQICFHDQIYDFVAQQSKWAKGPIAVAFWAVAVKRWQVNIFKLR